MYHPCTLYHPWMRGATALGGAQRFGTGAASYGATETGLQGRMHHATNDGQ